MPRENREFGDEHSKEVIQIVEWPPPRRRCALRLPAPTDHERQDRCGTGSVAGGAIRHQEGIAMPDPFCIGVIRLLCQKKRLDNGFLVIIGGGKPANAYNGRMPGNSFGELFRITTAGVSHGAGYQVIIDGCPPGLPLSVEDLFARLAASSAGTISYCLSTTGRRSSRDLVRRLRGAHRRHANRHLVPK